MEHLFTLDLDTMPELRSLGFASDTRAVAMFMHDSDNNEAFEPGNELTALVALSEADCQRPALDEAPGEEWSEYFFAPVPIDVPTDVWHAKARSPLGKLRSALYRHGARVLGEPLWVQDGEGGGAFVMQFKESFLDINMGDGACDVRVWGHSVLSVSLTHKEPPKSSHGWYEVIGSSSN